MYEHLDRQKTYARILFVDFSSAFNTIQPHLMVKKLLAMSVNPALIKWLFSFLTGRTQRVRVGKAISSARTTNTGAPQGCVLSPALFTLYTADCRSNSDASLLIKFTDDTSLTGLVERDEAVYRGGVQQLVEWCDSNFLTLNVSKTKELVVDFRVAPTDTETEPITIKGQSVEIMSAYKYLGIVIDNKLSWTPHINACYKKAQKKMYLLRKLQIFKVEQAIMQLFYQAVIQNAIFFNLVCFFGNTKKGDIDRLEKIIRTAGRIMRADPPSPSDIFQRAALRKLAGIQADTSHPLNGVVQSCAPARVSSRRLRSLKSWTTRRLNSFIPAAIRLHNAAL